MEKKPRPELNFTPITDGLGFHPFSDGLPYAPVSKTATSKVAPTPKPMAPLSPMGTGAVAAGTPRFSVPQVSVPRVSVPQASQPQPQAQAPAPTLQVDERYGFVYSFKRIFAFAIDWALNISLCLTALSFALVRQDIEPTALMAPEVLLLAVLFVLTFSWALVTAQEVAFGTSVGKRIFRMSLRGGPAAIFLRAFFFLPSVGFCGIGLLWAVFDRRRRCWHDLAADLQPQELARL